MKTNYTKEFIENKIKTTVKEYNDAQNRLNYWKMKLERLNNG